MHNCIMPRRSSKVILHVQKLSSHQCMEHFNSKNRQTSSVRSLTLLDDDELWPRGVTWRYHAPDLLRRFGYMGRRIHVCQAVQRYVVEPVRQRHTEVRRGWRQRHGSLPPMR